MQTPPDVIPRRMAPRNPNVAIWLGMTERPRPDRAAYTPQVPPNPTVTFPPSTMTGTCRPPERRIIRSNSFLSPFTSMYVNGTFLRA